MKKLLVVFLILAIYLNRSYAYFYDFLNQHPLSASIHKEALTVGSQPDLPTIKYLSLGDSLTAGIGGSDYRNSYPYLIAQKLSLKNNVVLINLGQPKDTSTDVLLNQIPKVSGLKPDLITVLIGINDVHDLIPVTKFEANLTQIVKALKQTNAKIYLLSIPYLGAAATRLPPYNFIVDFQIRQFNDVIKKMSTDFGANYIDLYSLKKPADFYSSDQFHPSNTGYSLWATYIIQFLNP